MAAGSRQLGAAAPTCMCQSSASSADCTNSCACHSSAAHRPWWSRMLGRRSVMMRPTLSTARSISRLMFWHLQRMRSRMACGRVGLACLLLAQALVRASSRPSSAPPAGCRARRAPRARCGCARPRAPCRGRPRARAAAPARRDSSRVRSATRSSSSSLACCSASAARRRSVMSTKVMTAPRTCAAVDDGVARVLDREGACRRARQNTSVSMRQGRPRRKALKIGQSVSG